MGYRRPLTIRTSDARRLYATYVVGNLLPDDTVIERFLTDALNHTDDLQYASIVPDTYVPEHDLIDSPRPARFEEIVRQYVEDVPQVRRPQTDKDVLIAMFDRAKIVYGTPAATLIQIPNARGTTFYEFDDQGVLKKMSLY